MGDHDAKPDTVRHDDGPALAAKRRSRGHIAQAARFARPDNQDPNQELDEEFCCPGWQARLAWLVNPQGRGGFRLARDLGFAERIMEPGRGGMVYAAQDRHALRARSRGGSAAVADISVVVAGCVAAAGEV